MTGLFSAIWKKVFPKPIIVIYFRAEGIQYTRKNTGGRSVFFKKDGSIEYWKSSIELEFTWRPYDFDYDVAKSIEL